MIQSFLCIPHIPVGHAGGRATQEQLPRTLMTQMIMMNTDNPNGLVSGFHSLQLRFPG